MAVRFGNVLGSQRQRDPEVQGADRARRPGDGDAPGHHSLLHDHPRGGAAGAAGRGHRRERPGAGAGHGRAGEDRRPGARPDPPGRACAGRDRDRVLRPAAGREAVRGAAGRRRRDAATAVPRLRIARLDTPTAAARRPAVAWRAPTGAAGKTPRCAMHWPGRCRAIAEASDDADRARCRRCRAGVDPRQGGCAHRHAGCALYFPA